MGVLFDTLLMVVLLRVLSQVPLPWTKVRNGAMFGAVLLTTMKFLGGILIERATASPLLGAVAVAVGLLFWLNLMSRVVLLAAPWAANDVDVARLASPPEKAIRQPTPQRYAAMPALPPPSSRAVDRVSVLAGAVLGVVGAALAGSLRQRHRT